MKKGDIIIEQMAQFYPDARCELLHENDFQMAVAVILSAQTNDAAVNKVTPALFKRYPNAYEMSQSSIQEIEEYIKTLGLYRNKAKSIYNLSCQLVEQYEGQLPHTMKELTQLSGVGRKSANVIMAECFNVPSFAVDTHVTRLSKRLKLAKVNDDVETIERKLKYNISKDLWIKAHHTMIFYGRYKCKAISPDCHECPFQSFCLTYNHKF